MARQFTLGKSERLKSRKLIGQLFSEGKRFAVTPFNIYFLMNEMPDRLHAIPNVQVGVSVPARRFKKAVDRNRIKRLIREAWRLQKMSMLGVLKEKKILLSIFLVYNGNELPEYKEVYGKMSLILQKLEKITDDIK